MRCFVVGSGRHLDAAKRPDFEGACKELGQALAVEEHTVLVCSQSPNTADLHIVQGIGSAHPRHKAEIVLYHPVEKDPIQDPTLFKQIHFTKKPSEGGWDVAHFAAINDADIVIAIGGSDGTLKSIYGADLLKKPVVLVKCFQGATVKAWGYFVHMYSDEVRPATLRRTDAHPHSNTQHSPPDLHLSCDSSFRVS